MADRIARAFNRSGAIRAVAFDISKAFDRVWYVGLLHKLKSYRVSGQIFGLISSFLSNKWLTILDGKSSQEYPVMLEFCKGPFLVLCFSCCILMTFQMMLSVILLSMLMILLSAVNLIRHLIFGNNVKIGF